MIPEWLRPIEEAARTIRAEDLTRFAVPETATPRRSAVLMLFGEGPDGPDLLFTERSHTMRSHPGQVSFPGGRLDPGETEIEAALREAEEEIGLVASGVEVFGTLPTLWLPPSNHAVTVVLGWWHEPHAVHAVSPDEVHAVLRAPISELCDPAHRVTVRSPRFPTYTSPGIWIGPGKDLMLWGFTGGIVTRLFTYVGWIEDMPDAPFAEVPEHMLQGRERE